jgi:hypothetical protein
LAKISKRQAMASLLPGGSYDTAGPARP